MSEGRQTQLELQQQQLKATPAARKVTHQRGRKIAAIVEDVQIVTIQAIQILLLVRTL